MTTQKQPTLSGTTGRFRETTGVNLMKQKGDDMAYRLVRFRESPPSPLNLNTPSSRTNTRHTYSMAIIFATA